MAACTYKGRNGPPNPVYVPMLLIYIVQREGSGDGGKI